MSSQPRRRAPEFLAAAAGVAAVLAGGLALAGWWLDIAPLRGAWFDLPPLVPNVAAGLALAGAALVLVHREPVPRARSWIAGALGAGAMLIGLLSFAEYLLTHDLGIDPLLLSSAATRELIRPAFHTALALTLLGLSLVLMDLPSLRCRQASQLLAVLATLVALLALIGHACRVDSFYGRFSFWRPTSGGMGPLAAALVACLGGGILVARPDRGLTAVLLSSGAGGVVARRLLLAPVAVPLFLGLLLRIQTPRVGAYGPELGSWLFSLANITVFTLVIWWSARAVHRAEDQRARAEEELRRQAGLAAMNRRLEEEVAERRRAEAALKEADRSKDEFLAMLGHELRNPLAPIRNAVSLMRLSGGADAKLTWCRDVIDRQAAHLSRLVDDLLDVSRVTRGLIHLRLDAVSLADVFHQAAETVRPLLEERRHELAVSLPSQPLALWGDATRLAQVFGNLLHNAAKYSEDGTRISLTAAREGRQVVVRVRDTGIGIDPAVLPHIFEPFAQGNRALDRAQGGLGIGLTLVRRLVEMHDGTVEAHSDGPGHGSEFVVRLPAPADKRTGVESGRGTVPGPSASARHSRRVLVVDDNGDAAESLALLLRLTGHDTRVAHDGPAALAEAEAFRPDAVLLDIGLPGMDGYEVARRMRGLTGVQSALLVAVTGYGQDEDRRRSKEAGFDHHVVKPADPADLDQILRTRWATT